MKRYVESSEDRGGLTLAELRHFLTVAESMDFPGSTRLRVKTKFPGPRGAKLQEISIDNRDREAS